MLCNQKYIEGTDCPYVEPAQSPAAANAISKKLATRDQLYKRVKETKRQGRIAHHHTDATVPHIVALLGFSFHVAKIRYVSETSTLFGENLSQQRWFFSCDWCVL